jgi:Type IIA topoisomerase (DNA gyrase/topo II, topoisomerase IV), A subunit
MVKKTPLKNYLVNKDFYQAIVLKEGDEAIGGEIADPNSTIFFVTSDGYALNSQTDEIPSQGRIAGGVIGVNLSEGANVIYAGQTKTETELGDGGAVSYPIGELVAITSKGLGKKIVLGEFEALKRNRKGIKIFDGELSFASVVTDPFDIGIVDSEKNLTILNTENIFLDSPSGRGRAVARGIKIKSIAKHLEEID